MTTNERTVFYVSDGTGITAETLGQTLLTQFPNYTFTRVHIPFVDSEKKAQAAVKKINSSTRNKGVTALVFCTVVDDEIREVMKSCNALFFDFFETFITPMEQELGCTSSHAVGRSHGMSDSSVYLDRMNAVNFAVDNDDGVTTMNYDRADIILVGVSRSGKTPVSLYLALQHGIHAANYPLTEEDLDKSYIPEILEPYREKLFGLIIDPIRLQKIRYARRPDSRYSSLNQCRMEVTQIQKIFKREKIRHVDSTSKSVEEICATILQLTGLKRNN
ncbi:MAG: kinase/pyrophosphorylase [Gammaproteobacteria bacterium]|nr:MAG: kinase/pyrophosphorylase [Gammaproteobacteria bacterium]